MGTVYGSRHLSNMFKPQNWSPGFLRIWNHHKPSIFWWYDWLILSHVFLGWNVTSELCFTQLRSASQTVVYSQYKTGDILNSWGAWNPFFFTWDFSRGEVWAAVSIPKPAGCRIKPLCPLRMWSFDPSTAMTFRVHSTIISFHGAFVRWELGIPGFKSFEPPKRFRKVQIITISIQSCNRMLLFDLFGDNYIGGYSSKEPPSNS